MNVGLRTGQVAEAAGVGRETLRYYERRGLLTQPERSLGGHRLYPPETVTVLRVIKAAQRLGFTLQEITDLLDAGAHQHGAPRPGLQQRAQEKLAEVDAKIADLTLIRQSLQDAVNAGCDDLHACAQAERCPLPFADLAEEHRHDGPCC